MQRGACRAWLAAADDLSARRQEAAARALAEPVSLAAAPGLLEPRIGRTRRCPHSTTQGAMSLATGR